MWLRDLTSILLVSIGHAFVHVLHGAAHAVREVPERVFDIDNPYPVICHYIEAHIFVMSFSTSVHHDTLLLYF